MKVITKVKFKDKKEGVIRDVGDTFSISKKRYEEILKVGKFVEEIKEETKEK
ncbi:hypothetical protein [Miniphocaeibacter massiliensis]|uniref:hypothetical protein n=1 Tax=Miniphocaeibacter massiliensis TaxID=2041841 RepID=UPI0013ED3DF4|nr:hypothetical protein [Miniphocaeibacter massiliensis]